MSQVLRWLFLSGPIGARHSGTIQHRTRHAAVLYYTPSNNQGRSAYTSGSELTQTEEIPVLDSLPRRWFN
jgi:hypothetical protein